MEEESNKAIIIGDRLIVNGKRYSPDRIPKRWRAGKITGKDVK